ncbi:VOC family protein [Marinimicrococcus flavescens]|uniref:VOC family protein n=1 Tax=Marinimicrococcus flavescens TaxID=3031815 RepID=A0AAP3XR51_9PROT|nr:VOC family protein [Marinimicrococcus flavescens]
MQLSPYLSFDGQCEAAFSFYQTCTGGEILTMLAWENSPMADQTPPGWGSKILHARMRLGNGILMGGDGPPDRHEPMKGFSVTLGIEEPAEAERIFAMLAEGGIVRMPLQETFWALRFGMLVDRFGTPWMVNCERPA